MTKRKLPPDPKENPNDPPDTKVKNAFDPIDSVAADYHKPTGAWLIRDMVGRQDGPPNTNVNTGGPIPPGGIQILNAPDADDIMDDNYLAKVLSNNQNNNLTPKKNKE